MGWFPPLPSGTVPRSRGVEPGNAKAWEGRVWAEWIEVGAAPLLGLIRRAPNKTNAVLTKPWLSTEIAHNCGSCTQYPFQHGTLQ